MNILHHKSVVTMFCQYFIDKTIRCLEKMPMAQGSIISVVLGISIGSIVFDNVQTAAFVTTWLLALMSITLGSATVWLASVDIRGGKKHIMGAVLMLICSSILQLGLVGDPYTLRLLQNIALMLLIFGIFMLSVHGYSTRVDREEDKKEK